MLPYENFFNVGPPKESIFLTTINGLHFSHLYTHYKLHFFLHEIDHSGNTVELGTLEGLFSMVHILVLELEVDLVSSKIRANVNFNRTTCKVL